MSYQNYQKAIEIATRSKKIRVGKGVSAAYLDAIQEKLCITLSPIHRDFLLNYAPMTIGKNSLLGLVEDATGEEDALDNLLSCIRFMHEKFSIPQTWIPVMVYNDGCIAYMDYSGDDINEPNIKVIFFASLGCRIEIDNNRANDLGDFLFDLINGGK